MPGTYTRESISNPGVGVNIRGLEGSGRVNMMIDGVRQNFRFTGHEAQGFVYVDRRCWRGSTLRAARCRRLAEPAPWWALPISAPSTSTTS